MTLTIDGYFDLLDDKLVKAENKIMRKAVHAMIDKTTVVTGELVGGYEFVPATKKRTALIYNDVEYFDYVNDGTINQAPQDMVGAGLATIPSDFTTILRNV